MSNIADYSYTPITRIDHQVSWEAGFTMRSPILSDLLNSLSSEEYLEVLDIIPANQGVIDAFSGLNCKLHLPGCLAGLSEITTQKYDTPTKLHRAFTRLFGFYKRQRASLNVILLWDLPNYLEKPVMSALINYLSEHLHDSARLHFYIHTKHLIPASPGRYTIEPGGEVFSQNSDDKMVESPLYFQEALQTLMQPFMVKRSMLLSGGLQEYVLEQK